MFRFDGREAPRIGLEGVAAGGSVLDAFHPRQAVRREVVVPHEIADVFLRHHAVPFAAGDILVVFLHQRGVPGEGALDLVGPGVGGRVLAAGQGQVHRLRVIHFIDVGEGLDREEDEFPVGVLVFWLQGEELPQGLRFQADEIVPHLAEFAGRQVIGPPVHHFGRGAAAVLAIEVEDARGLLGLVVTEGCRAEGPRVVRQVLHRDGFGIARHRKEQAGPRSCPRRRPR